MMFCLVDENVLNIRHIIKKYVRGDEKQNIRHILKYSLLLLTHICQKCNTYLSNMATPNISP